MIELHPFLQVLIGGLFLAVFAIASVRNSGSDDDEDENDRSEKSQQAGGDDV